MGPVAKANILVDMIIQNVSHESLTDISFTIPRVDVKKAMPIIQDTAKDIGAKSVSVTEAIAKVSWSALACGRIQVSPPRCSTSCHRKASTS